MTTRLAPQRGVAALMAVLFLLFMLGVVLVIAHQMAATDVHDSGAHNLSVEALFLAESGIERASRRYRDNGALCAANGLAEVPMSIAGGTRRFSIISSAGNATTCTVNARGEIDNIRRQIQVVLQRTAGGGVITDPGFDNPGLWPAGGSNAAILAGSAIFFNPPGGGTTRNQLRANPAPGGALDTSAFAPGVSVAMTVSFTYTIGGTVNIRVSAQVPGPDPTASFNNLTGSGTITMTTLGTFDPTVVTQIQVDIQNFGNGEWVVMDNFNIGPAAGGALTVSTWTEIVP